MAELTTQELHVIEDQLQIEQILVKKYKCYASMSQDPQIKTVCEQIAAQHKCHFDILMGYISG